MCKCIYCNSDDLTVSDIISLALTGSKITKKFVCEAHNKYTNVNYEKVAIAKLDFFRNALGLTTRDGNIIKYKADLRIDGVKIPNVNISNRASIYEDRKRLFATEHDGKKVLIGNVDLLSKKKGVIPEKIEPLDMSSSIVSFTFSLEELFASKEMILTIAKIAYEWHCYINNICEYNSERYGNIVSFILGQNPNNNFVEISIDGNLDYAIKTLCDFGTHALYEYIDIDGYCYVVFDFWGVIIYKVRIYDANKPNECIANTYDLFLYRLDGTKAQTCFGTLGKARIVSTAPQKAVKEYHKAYISRLEQLVKMTVLSLPATKRLVEEVRQAINEYKRTPHNIARLLDYESGERISAIKILKLLSANNNVYDFDKTFNENLKMLLQVDETLVITQEENKSFIESLVALHNEEKLLCILVEGLTFFDCICEREL